MFLNVRVYRRRGSDGLMNIKFDKPPLRSELVEKISKRNQIMEDCGKWCVADIPFDKEKVH